MRANNHYQLARSLWQFAHKPTISAEVAFAPSLSLHVTLNEAKTSPIRYTRLKPIRDL